MGQGESFIKRIIEIFLGRNLYLLKKVKTY